MADAHRAMINFPVVMMLVSVVALVAVLVGLVCFWLDGRGL